MSYEKKSILVITQSLNVGGVERALISLLSVIPLEKYTVDLVLSKKEGDFLYRMPQGIDVYEAPYKNGIKAGEGIADIIRILKRERRYASWLVLVLAVAISKVFHNNGMLSGILYQKQGKQYDYLFNFAGVNNLTHLLSACVYSARYKYIWVHGDSDAEGFVKYKDIYAYYDRIFCVSNKVTEKLRQFIPEFADKTDTIYNELDEDAIITQSKEASGLIRQKRETILLTVGRLDACKGYDIAIDACKRLKHDGYNIKWYIVGEGIERKKLEDSIRENKLENEFILLGLKSNPYPYYRTTDIYVQTSVSEGYCITLAEAKLFFKPIVTTDFSGADEQIRNEINGYIVSSDAVSIAKKIELLIDDIEKQKSFSNKLKNERVNNSFGKLEEVMLRDNSK